MGKMDPRVDAYIAKTAEFAQPILNHLRALVHRGCPDVEETIRWGMPMFDYQGPLCSMAAFKKHCVFGFWKADLLDDATGPTQSAPQESKATNWGAPSSEPVLSKLVSRQDLPKDAVLLRYIKRACKLNEQGIKVPKKTKAPLPVPPQFAAALKKAKTAKAHFDKMSPSHRREYLEWIGEAKRAETRDKRITTAIEWLTEGKSRNWKYEKKK